MGKKEEIFTDLYAKGYEVALSTLAHLVSEGVDARSALEQLLDEVATQKREDYNRITDSGTLNRNTTSR
jgi:hypothetical protein